MAKKTTAKQVRVKVKGGIDPRSKEVIGQPLFEGGEVRQPGTEFIVDEERAEALGDSVEILGEVAAPNAEAPKE